MAARRRVSLVRQLLDEFDAGQCDGLLIALSDVADPGSIVIRSVPRRARHGHHAVTWSQDGRSTSVEGYTLHVALQAAVRRISGQPAQAST
jgi:hypothetical protein